MLQRFSIGLRSGEDGGHTMSFSPFMPIAANDTEVFFAAWDGALSCMKKILLRKAQFFFLYHGRKWSVRNSIYFAEVIFTPSGTLKGPTSSLPMILAQNMTPPPPCWCRSLVGTWWPSTNHPLLHPSVPSRVARHSSVNKTVWKLVFMYVWAHCNRFCLCALFRGGRNSRFMHNCKLLKDPTPWGLRDSRGTSSFKLGLGDKTITICIAIDTWSISIKNVFDKTFDILYSSSEENRGCEASLVALTKALALW